MVCVQNTRRRCRHRCRVTIAIENWRRWNESEKRSTTSFQALRWLWQTLMNWMNNS